jgi:hypothetical protein
MQMVRKETKTNFQPKSRKQPLFELGEFVCLNLGKFVEEICLFEIRSQQA